MIGMTYGLLRINEVNTMTTRQNDLVVKKKKKISFCQRLILVPSMLHSLKAEKRFRKSYSILFIPNVLVCLLLQQWHNETFVKEYYQNVI